MGSLSDAFSPDFVRNHTNNTLTVGSVIKSYQKNTNPPKYKYFIVIGKTEGLLMLGAVFINTGTNINVHRTPAAKKLQLSLLLAENSFLEHDSFVDCTEIVQQSNNEIAQEYEKNNYVLKGEVSQATLAAIHIALKQSGKIKPGVLKSFGIL